MSAPLFQNAWFGKAVGCVAAFIFAGEGPVALSLSILVGIGLGHVIDEWAQRSKSPTDATPPELAERRLICLIMGHVAKQGGTVQRAHLKIAEHWFSTQALNRAERAQAIRWFNEGKSLPLTRLKSAAMGRAAPASDLSRLLASLAAVQPSDRVLAAAVKGAGLLGIEPAVLTGAFEHAVGGGPSRPDGEAGVNDHPLQWAYDQLGLEPGASTAEAKTAYRRLVSRYHPDKLGPNASQNEIEHGKEQLVALQSALNAIQSA